MKFVKYLLPSKWTTVWVKQIHGTVIERLTGNHHRFVPMVLFLEKSNKGKLRFQMTDGTTTQKVNNDYIRGTIDGADEEYRKQSLQLTLNAKDY